MMSLTLRLTTASVPTLKPLEETPMEDVGQNDPLQLSDSTRAALDQLLSQIDQATSTVDANLTPDSYAALAALPLSYPWSCLVLDLKELLPILDRYVLSCIIASHATGLPGGDQLCHWNTLSPGAVFQATHLIVFLPSCLGAFILSNHSSHNPAFFKYSYSDTQTDESPTACVKQVDFPLPSLLFNQNETLQTARFVAADGYLSAFTIPLLCRPIYV